MGILVTFAVAALTAAEALPSALNDGFVPFAPLRPLLVVVLGSLVPLDASDLESSATVAVRCCRGGAMADISNKNQNGNIDAKITNAVD